MNKSIKELIFEADKIIDKKCQERDSNCKQCRYDKICVLVSVLNTTYQK